MRLRSRFAAVVAAVFLLMLLVSGAFYAYLAWNGRRIFNEQITALTRRHVEARSVQAVFPAWIIVSDLSIDDVLTCARARVLVDAASMFRGVRRINRLELEAPVIVWQRDVTREPAPLQAQGEAVPQERAARTAARTAEPLVLGHLVVHNGVLKVQGNDGSGVKGEYQFEHVQLQADNVLLTGTPGRTHFAVTASLAKLNVPFMGHFLKASGWFNWAARDMDAAAQVIDDDGRVSVDAKFASRQNDLTVFGTVKLAGDQQPQATGERAGLLENVVLGALGSTQTDIVADFSLRTKMDRVDPHVIKLSGHITTGLNSSVTSGNIVAGLKAASEELLKEPADLAVPK